MSDSDESLFAAVTKKKLSCGRRKMQVLISDSESELEYKTVKDKRISGKVRATLGTAYSKQF